MVAIVLSPFTAQLYSAIRSRGAFLTLLDAELSLLLKTTNLPLKFDTTSRSLPLNTNIVPVQNIKFPATAQNGHHVGITYKLVLSVSVNTNQGQDSTGSLALDLCNVACGTADVKYSPRSRVWEVCAGWLIVVESGGMVLNGSAYNNGTDLLKEPQLWAKDLIAVRAMLAKEEIESLAMDYKVLVNRVK
jgi:myo-inositol-1(or 4)-monophosphatase